MRPLGRIIPFIECEHRCTELCEYTSLCTAAKNALHSIDAKMQKSDKNWKNIIGLIFRKYTVNVLA